MSEPSEFELDLDLQLLPAWARQSSTENRYAKFEGEPEQAHERRRGDRPGRPDQWRDRPPRRDRPPGPRPGGQRPSDGPRSGPPQRGEGRPDRRPHPHPRREDRREAAFEPPAPLPEINLSFTPDDKGVESLARQIRLTGRAYPLFDIAVLILKKAERFQVQFSVKRGADGNVLQPLFVCSLDESLWLSQDEVLAHVLRQHFGTFYQTERVATDPPKGIYTFVAQCGMSGVILGPPNYHDYQTKLRKLHAERFARMPFEVFKSRVKIVKDEAVVRKWVEEQSWKTEYVCLNLPEPKRLGTREEVEQHFREVHLANLLKTVDSFTAPGGAQRTAMSAPLQALVRRGLDEQRRFPLRVATVLSQQFGNHGLQFFKVNKTVTHVSVARPRYLDIENTVVSEGVRRIVELINTMPGCNRRKLIETLAPSPAPPAPPAGPAGPAEAGVAPAAPAEAAPTQEQTAVIADLHWLAHQGHVIEFSDGRMETAKAPKPRPVTPPAAAPAGSVPAPATPDAAIGPSAASTATADSPAPASALPIQPATLPDAAGTDAGMGAAALPAAEIAGA
jgi:hypothetical protein